MVPVPPEHTPVIAGLHNPLVHVDVPSMDPPEVHVTVATVPDWKLVVLNEIGEYVACAPDGTVSAEHCPVVDPPISEQVPKNIGLHIPLEHVAVVDPVIAPPLVQDPVTVVPLGKGPSWPPLE